MWEACEEPGNIVAGVDINIRDTAVQVEDEEVKRVLVSSLKSKKKASKKKKPGKKPVEEVGKEEVPEATAMQE